MDTRLEEKFKKEPLAIEARRLIKACVHCGYCNASCPTYQLLGDELDGPRGRIYLLKSFLEGRLSAEKVKMHLDRCLLCQGCETACPSNVEYGKLAILGKEIIEQSLKRSFLERLLFNFLLHGIADREKFYFFLRIFNLLRPFLPGALRRKLPPLSKEKVRLEQWARKGRVSQRRLILFKGCVEPVLYPSVLRAARNLFGRLDIDLVDIPKEGCCGALAYHLPNRKKAVAQAKKNIDLWIKPLQNGVEGIVVCSSACCQMIKEYGSLLKDDKEYGQKALKIASRTFDPVEILEKVDRRLFLLAPDRGAVAYHSPCTSQHGLKGQGRVEAFLKALNIKLAPIADSQMCCGSAGLYSLVQKDISQKILELKMKNLLGGNPAVILTANVGCRLQLEQLSPVPVLHWLEYVERLMQEDCCP
ncbi:glycolate oxidase subunit GlcF [Candidatus Methylacidiphilum infernorum]|uniref:Glycolate oxidase iron-sulfur subunit n=1 Tax=Candidatus Methylacidiphilum infernorum TaxID=511746 RepID=A0ABX7PUR9_9BACT|nr:glycolate oxidase subunit GlcF [Candidatus Methylacidiphilum infernorum]QSR86652.1 glycolate oxidase subunit GlcF [Candidatus Methylacidiphilum infernorum]